jgi:hypothetical protein
MKAIVNKCNTLIEATVDVNLEVAYYNTCNFLWEPLLEPVDCTEGGIIDQRSYEFTVTTSKCPSRRLELTLKSTDTMELTITRSFLDEYFALNATFWEAASQQVPPIRIESLAQYVLHNQLDTNVVLHFDNSDLIIDEHTYLTERKKVFNLP